MPGAALRRLPRLAVVDDERVAELVDEPARLIELLADDEQLHDATLLSIAESLDEWSLFGFQLAGRVHFLAAEARGGAGAEVVTSAVDLGEYEPVVTAARRYWQDASGIGAE